MDPYAFPLLVGIAMLLWNFAGSQYNGKLFLWEHCSQLLQATGHLDSPTRMGQGFYCILNLALTTVVLPFAAVLVLRRSRVGERQGWASSLRVCQQVEIHGAGMGGGEGGI